MSYVSQTDFLNTGRAQDAQLQQELSILDKMDFLHRVFANSSNQDVDLRKLGPDDFMLSKEFVDLSQRFIEAGFPIIIADKHERTVAVNVAVTLG